ncbi:helix-turn-helix domain-containing protein [Dysgonomonas sp. Marseille-P4677]|uniref:helix-turn-helix domain-containing protein n=1 Tax=Dysgonomonas sp. Marseille-P4677 TaxID=2364790 RepID=UPI00191486E7|nr:helix-turn-helix domain-containing protein [Dysgonomonas sp. Marseille-P4677]MBK5721322.1 helix-turn-helix domain-containing protein [Dysgonomonas sp. Marseille-P4677]
MTTISNEQSEVIEITPELFYNYQVKTLSVKGVEIKLTRKEAGLMHLLTVNKNQVLDRKAALELLWGDDNYFNARCMDVFITKLRHYIKPVSCVKILNVRSQGHLLQVSKF